MKAWVLEDVDRLSFREDVAEPNLSDSEVLARTMNKGNQISVGEQIYRKMIEEVNKPIGRV